MNGIASSRVPELAQDRMDPAWAGGPPWTNYDAQCYLFGLMDENCE